MKLKVYSHGNKVLQQEGEWIEERVPTDWGNEEKKY